MPGYPLVSNPSLGLFRNVDPLIDSVPVRLLLTKKIAPPPSFARFPVIRVLRNWRVQTDHDGC